MIITALETGKFENYEMIKDRIVFRLKNKLVLGPLFKARPHIEWMDLVITFEVVYELTEERQSSIPINNEYMEMWGLNLDDLYRLSEINTPILFPFKFANMADFLGIGLAGDLGLYVLTNDVKTFGATCLLYEEAFKYCIKELDRDFFILPSSIHEVILVPADRGYEREELCQIVKSVNQTDVRPDEILSNQVYKYCKNTGLKFLEVES